MPLPGAPATTQPTRFHGTVPLDWTRVGRDASRIADEAISHLPGLVGARVTVTLEIHADVPSGAPDHVVRTVTENSRTLKFTNQGFEKEQMESEGQVSGRFQSPDLPPRFSTSRTDSMVIPRSTALHMS